jgi:hypothetical protein
MDQLKIGYVTKCDTCQKDNCNGCKEYRDYSMTIEELNMLLAEIE